MGKKVNLFIVGAAKSGTTSLVDFLEKVEGVFIPKVKEPFYFVNESIGLTSFNEYQYLYRKSDSESFLVDASTGYLYSENACQRIYNYNKDSKIVIVLRNPVDMVHSLWSYMIANGVEDRNLIEALNAECTPCGFQGEGWWANYLYRDRASYAGQVKKYLNRFRHVKIIVFEDLIENQERVLSELLDFLGLEYSCNLSLPRSNEGGAVNSNLIKKIRDRKYPLLKRMISPEIRVALRTFVRDLNTSKARKNYISENERLIISRYFKNDVLELGSLGVDTSYWSDFS